MKTTQKSEMTEDKKKFLEKMFFFREFSINLNPIVM